MSAALDLLGGLVLEDGRRWGEVAVEWQWQDAEAILDLDAPTPFHYLLDADVPEPRILDGLVRASDGLSLGRRGAPESEGAEGDERDSDGISDVDAVTPREDEEYGIPSVRVEPDERGSERYRHDSQSSDHDAANLSDLAAGGGSKVAASNTDTGRYEDGLGEAAPA